MVRREKSCSGWPSTAVLLALALLAGTVTTLVTSMPAPREPADPAARETAHVAAADAPASPARRRRTSAFDRHPDPEASSELIVLVYDEATRQPVADAEVVWLRAADPYDFDAARADGRTTRTGADGRATIARPMGRLMVRAFAAGRTGESAIPEAERDELRVGLRADWRVEGRIRDELGLGLGGLPVVLRPCEQLSNQRSRSVSGWSAWRERTLLGKGRGPGHALTGNDGRFAVQRIQERLPGWELDDAGRPRLEWTTVCAGRVWSGRVDHDTPLDVVLPAMGAIEVDWVVPGVDDLSEIPEAPLTLRIDVLREGYHQPLAPTRLAERSTTVRAWTPVGAPMRLSYEVAGRKSTVQLEGPPRSGAIVRHRVEVPRARLRVRGRLVGADPAVPALRRIAFRDGVTGEWTSVTADDDGRFDTRWWGDGASPSVAEVCVDVPGYALLDRRFLPPLDRGEHDLGEFLVEPVEPRTLATFVVSGLEPESVPVPGVVRFVPEDGRWAEDPAIGWRPLGGSRFALLGHSWTARVPEHVAAPETLSVRVRAADGGGAAASCEVGATGVLLHFAAPTSRVEIEFLVPDHRLQDRLQIDLHRRGEGAAAPDFEPPGSLFFEAEVAPGNLDFTVRDGTVELMTWRGARVPDGGRLLLTGPDAVDLRSFYRAIEVTIVDANGRFATGCESRWVALPAPAEHPLMGELRGGVDTLWLPLGVKTVCIRPERCRPHVVDASSHVEIPRIELQPVQVVATLPDLPTGIIRSVGYRILNDVSGLETDDPRRRACKDILGDGEVDAGRSDGERLRIHRFAGDVLEATVWLRRGGRDASIPVEVGRTTLSIALDQEVYNIPVEPGRLREVVAELMR